MEDRMALNKWEKIKISGLKSDTWQKKDGIELTSYGRTTKYPFIQISEDKSSPTKTYRIRLVTTHRTIELPEYKYGSLKPKMTKLQALEIAKEYMKNH